MIKKLFSIIFALIFTLTSFSILSVETKAASKVYYKPNLALTYASKNWNNGVGLCADFVSKCLQAGGINVFEPRVVNLYNKLNGTYGTSYKLTLTSGTRGSIKLAANSGKLEAGDPIFYYCNRCRTFTHVVLCNGANAFGYVQDYAHNNAHNGKKQTYSYFHCGTQNWTMYSIHLDREPDKYGKKTNVGIPEITSIKNSANGIAIQWTPIPGADNYRVYRKTSTTNWKLIGQPKNNKVTDKKAQNGVKYTYTIRAVDNKVFSQYYAGKTITSLAAPTLSIDNRVGYTLLKWTKVPKADGYHVYCHQNNKWVRIATIKGGDKTSYKFKTVKNGENYRFTVKAYDGKLNGAYPSPGASKFYVEAPHTFNAYFTNEGINITFAKIQGAQKYKIYRKAEGEKSWTALGFTTTNSFVDSTTSPGIKYTYTARATNGKSYSWFYPEALVLRY